MQGIRVKKGVGAGGRLSGAKRRQRNNFGPLWKESHRRLRGGGDVEIKPHTVVAVGKEDRGLGSRNDGTDTGYSQVGE